MVTLEDLGKRIQILDDKEAIKELKTRYGQLVDSRFDGTGRMKGGKDLESIASDILKLFTEDAVWDRGKELGILKGRKQLYEHFRQPGYDLSVHYFLDPVITVEENTASAHWYLLMLGTTRDIMLSWLAADMDDQYIKINGNWLITHVRSNVIFFLRQ